MQSAVPEYVRSSGVLKPVGMGRISNRPSGFRSNPRSQLVTPNGDMMDDPFEMEYHQSAVTPEFEEDAPMDELRQSPDAPVVKTVKDDMPMDEAFDANRQTHMVVREEERQTHQAAVVSKEEETQASPVMVRHHLAVKEQITATPSPSPSSVVVSTRFTKSPKLERARQRLKRGSSKPQTESHVTAGDAADRGGGIGPTDKGAKPKGTVAGQTFVRPTNLTPAEVALWNGLEEKISDVLLEASEKSFGLEREIERSVAQLKDARQHEMELDASVEQARGEIELAKNKSVQPKGDESPSSMSAKEHLHVRGLEDKLVEMEMLHKEAREKAASQEVEHKTTVRAINRVLADVSSERDAAVGALSRKLTELGGVPCQTRVSEPVDTPVKSEEGASELARGVRPRRLHWEEADSEEGSEGELTAKELQFQLDFTKGELEVVKKKRFDMQASINLKEKQIKKLKRHLRAIEKGQDVSYSQLDADVEEIESLRKELEEREASLEKANIMVASLENANSTLANSNQAKSKGKDEQLVNLETDAVYRQHKLDILALELRDVQIRKDELEKAAKNERVQETVLAKHLERALTELRAVSVVHEASVSSGMADEETLVKISQILNTALVALQVANSEAVHDAIVDEDKISIILSDPGSSSSELNRQLDSIIQSDREAAAQGLLHALEDKRETISRLEAALKTTSDTLETLLSETMEAKLQQEEEQARVREEITALQDQLKMNADVLAKKDLALEVLRESLEGTLNNDEGEMAAGEGGEEGKVTHTSPQAEALAALLAKGASPVEAVSTYTMQELKQCRAEMAKARDESKRAAEELQAEKDNLANAKLIISSLERANKNMVDDLRGRLNDSNTAISTLLDQTGEHDKVTAALNEEIEQLKAKNAALSKEHSVEMVRIKDENIVTALRLAAKEREIKDMHAAAAETVPEIATVGSEDYSVEVRDKYMWGPEGTEIEEEEQQ